MIRRYKISGAVAVALTVIALTINTPASAFNGLKGIVGLDVGDSEVLFIRFDSNLHCGTPIGYVPRSAAYYNDIYAMVLTAQANNKPVNSYIASCDSEGRGKIVRMISGFVF